jgi:hypothetical protein
MNAEKGDFGASLGSTLRHWAQGLAVSWDLATPPASGIYLSHKCHIPAQVQHITVEHERLPQTLNLSTLFLLKMSPRTSPLR